VKVTRTGLLTLATIVGLAFALGAGAPQGESTAGGPKANRLGMVCEYGITLAFRGELASAESSFLSLLSSTPRDPRALTNLGNVQLLRGEFKDALGFFARARKGDSKDPGILLDQAIAYLLLGEDESALKAAREAISLAGGLSPAATLIGFSPEGRPSDSVKAGEQLYLNKNEIRALLEAAAAATPPDSLSAAVSKTSSGTGKKGRKRIWRSAGTRGEDYHDAAALIYWKR
jgi:tetratricopeptide (TPR) repeat protein